MPRSGNGVRLVLTLLLLLPSLSGCDAASTPPVATPEAAPTGDARPSAPASTETVAAVPTATTAPPQATSLHVGWLESPQILSPFSDEASPSDTIIGLVFDRLMHREADGSYSPSLALAWQSEDDGRTWTFSLRAGVRTHDGVTFTAEDAVFSIFALQNSPRFYHFAGFMQDVARVEAAGPLTLVVEFGSSVRSVEALLHWIPMVPRHVWNDIDVADPAGAPADTLIGTGPFVLREFVAKDRVTLSANRDYWLGPPSVDEVTFSTYFSSDALAEALLSGHVDLITEVPISAVAALRESGTCQVVSGPGNSVRELVINTASVSAGSGNLALLDPMVRTALAMSIDRQQMVDLALAGQGLPGRGVIPPVLHEWYTHDLAVPSFDLDAANRLLDDAGYMDSNGDGVRELPDSEQQLRFRLFAAAEFALAGREIEMLGNWLRQVGIGLLPQTLLGSAMSDRCCPTCDFDLMLMTFRSGPDPGTVLSRFVADAMPGARNCSGYHRTEADVLFGAQAAATTLEERRQALSALETRIALDSPSIALYYPLRLQAFRSDRFRNWRFIPNDLLDLTDVRSLVQVQAAD